MTKKKQTTRPMTEKEKQVAKRKLHKAELECVRAMLKDGLQITVNDMIEAIEKEPNGATAMSFFMEYHGKFFVDDMMCKSQPDDTPDKIKERNERWERIKEPFYRAFYFGLVNGVVSYNKYIEQDLKTLREIKEQDNKAAAEVAESK